MDSQYQLELKSQQNNKIYSFESADGIYSKKSFRDEEILLADQVLVKKSDKILVIQSGFGFLGTVLGDNADKVTMYETSARASQFSKKNAENNQIENFQVVNKPEISDIEESFDKILYAPADYTPVDLVKKRLAQAADKTTDEGNLYIAGKKKTGLKRYKNFLKQFSHSKKTGKRNGVKAYKFSEFTEPPAVSVEKNFKAKFEEEELEFKTSEGLFSSGKLDKGTRILLENIEQDKPDKILDLACGYGAVTAFMAQKYDSKYYLTDDDARAIRYAEENMKNNQINSYQVKTGDCFDAYSNHKFDLIVSNPPTHQGKGVTNKMFRQAAESLKENGEFWLVYNQNMKYENKLKTGFNRVQEINEEENFKVVKAVK